MSTSKLKSWNTKAWGHPKTCPASRHAAMIANDLRSNTKGGYGKYLEERGYEPAHMGDSIESAIISLWKARRLLVWAGKTNKDGDLVKSDWFPIGQVPKGYVTKEQFLRTTPSTGAGGSPISAPGEYTNP